MAHTERATAPLSQPALAWALLPLCLLSLWSSATSSMTTPSLTSQHSLVPDFISAPPLEQVPGPYLSLCLPISFPPCRTYSSSCMLLASTASWMTFFGKRYSHNTGTAPAIAYWAVIYDQDAIYTRTAGFINPLGILFHVHMGTTHLVFSWASPDMDGCCIKLACKKILVEPSFSIASDSPTPWVPCYQSILLTQEVQAKDQSTTTATMKLCMFQKSSIHFPLDVLCTESAPLRTIQ